MFHHSIQTIQTTIRIQDFLTEFAPPGEKYNNQRILQDQLPRRRFAVSERF